MSLARKISINASAMAGGRIINAVLGVVAVGLSSRYLGVQGYGALVAGIAFSGLVAVVTDIGIWTTGVREIAKEPDDSQRIVGALLTLGLALSVIAVVVGVVAALLLYGAEDEHLTRRTVLFLLITVPLSAPAGAITAYFIARQQAYIGMIGSVGSSVFQLGALVVVVTLGWGLTGVLLVYVLAAMLQFLILLVASAGRVRLVPSADLHLAKRLLFDAVPLGGAMIVHQLYWRIDIVLLSVLASGTQVALYGLSYKFVDVLAVMPGFVTITLLPEFARLAADRPRFDEILQKSFNVMLVGALAILILFVVFAKEIIETVGGSQFEGAAVVLQLLMVGVALTFVGSTLGQALVAAERQKSLLRMTLLLLPASIVLNAVLIPLWGAKGAAIAFGITELVHLTALLVLYRRVGSIPRLQRAPQVLAATALMAAVALAMAVVFPDGASPLAVLLVGGTASMLVYVGALYALHAMPREVHAHLVMPLYTKLRPKRAAV